MFFGLLTFLTALTISAVAIYYSVAGLAAIFAAAVVPIIVMGVSLEVGKLVTAVWLHKNWSRAKWWLKTYLSIAVFVLMFITSMGIFGFLSKAHIEQTSMSEEQVALIETLNDKEARSEAKINRWTEEMDRLMKGEDVRVDSLIEKEQVALKELYAQIKAEKDAARTDADKQIQLQNDRLTQAAERKEADIKAAKDRFEGSLGGGAKYDKAVEVAKANELSVASSAQREIRNINSVLNETLAKIDEKYKDDITAINDRIQELRNQANNKTQDIDGRIIELEAFIDKEQNVIDDVREERLVNEKTYRQLEAEVGPIKYIAEFVYGENADQNLLEAAVRWVIIIIIFVFDPLAVLLLIASQYTFNWSREDKGLNGPGGGSKPGKSNKDPEPEDTFEDVSPEELVEEERKEQEQLRAKKIAENVPPVIEKEKTTHEMLMEGFEEEQKQRAIEEQNEEFAEMYTQEPKPLVDGYDPREVEGYEEFNKKYEEPVDTVAEEIEEAMKGEGDDLDKWNNWVEAANKEAEENPEDKDIPDTANRIFYNTELEDQKKRQAESKSYITKVSNKQIRLKTQDPTTQK